ncbi:MAG: hypothetical protein WKG32_16040 [Gemmatimonadaceae bacterium]
MRDVQPERTRAFLELVAGRRGHFRLESGHHGRLWLDLDPLFTQPARIAPFVASLATAIRPYTVAAVCGPLLGGAFLAQLVAHALDVEFCFTERVLPAGSSDALYRARYRLPPVLSTRLRGQRIALVDDVMSAGSALRGTYAELQAHGATPVVAERSSSSAPPAWTTSRGRASQSRRSRAMTTTCGRPPTAPSAPRACQWKMSRLPLPDARSMTPARALASGTLAVGVLDILDAFIFFGLRGAAPVRILQSIAAGLLGPASFRGGASTAALGLLLHFFIAGAIVVTYYLASRRLPDLARRPLLYGPLYGLTVYAVMTFVVLPLSAAGAGARPLPVLINGLLIHALGVGVPSALAARAAARSPSSG